MNLAQGSRQQQGGVLAEFVVVTGFIIMPLIVNNSGLILPKLAMRLI